MDSFEIFPEEVWTEIFSSLERKDLLRASLVSKDWYRMIGRSPICMKKLFLRKYENLENSESILSSSRLYQNLSLTYLKDKNITTENAEVVSATVDKFSESLVSIIMSHDVEVKSNLPNLKSLYFLNYERRRTFKSGIVPNGLLTKAKHLTYLEVDFYYLDTISVICLRNFFIETSGLKILKMRDCRPIIGLNSTNLKLRIEEFYFSWMLDHNFQDLLNIRDFFIGQSSSLKIVECAFSHEIMQFFMSNFPNLHKMIVNASIVDYNRFGNPDPEYPVNMSIKELTLEVGIYGTIIDHFRVHAIATILNSYNLERLNIVRIHPEVLDTILCCRSLKIVKYKELDEEVNKDDLERNNNIQFIQEDRIRY